MKNPTSLAETLKNISLDLVRAHGLEAEIAAASRLAAFYQELVQHENINILKTNESALQGGVALSTYDAAICVDEHLRTTRFIKGVYQAIQTLYQRFDQQPIHVLYAGCGPYATLLLPLLPLLNMSQMDITFLDIHEPSLQSVTQLMRTLGFENLPVQLVKADALTYKAKTPVHLVVSETMFEALKNEPQVNITKNLAPQLVKGGILVPQEINIDLVYTFRANEPYFSTQKQAEVYRLPAYAHRQVIDRLFSLNQTPGFFQDSPGNKFLSKVYTAPDNVQLAPDICLFTDITVFNDIYLHTAQSTITNPYGIYSAIHFADDKTFRLEYDFNQIPGWKIKIPASEN